MTWARLDDRFHEHWKVIEAGVEAVGLWTMCLTWASQARRTSPTPGVVPDSVLTRFAGGKAKRLAAKLHAVGLFDDKTDAGWPIHDYDDYLPKYDAEANRERGRRGGQAKAAKQTASEPLSEPPEESVADAKQTFSTRASVRRNPVPVPSEEAKASSAQTPESANAGTVVKTWIDGQRRRPPDRLVGQVATQVKALLDEGFEPDAVGAAVAEMSRKGLNPATLPSLVNQLANAPTADPDRERIEEIRRHNAERPWDPIALPVEVRR